MKLALYTTPDCPKCKRLKEIMNRAGCKYEESEDFTTPYMLQRCVAPVLIKDDEIVIIAGELPWNVEEIISNLMKETEEE